MSKSSFPTPSRAIGHTLKRWRESRGLTLRGVARASKDHHVQVTFDYLSKLENGQLMPSIPKLTTLAAVYQQPISELVDLYEIEQLRRLVPAKGSYDLYRKLGIQSLKEGSLTKALACFLGALEAAKRKPEERQTIAVAQNNVASAMIRSGRYLSARQYLEEGLRFAETERTRGHLFNNLAIVFYHLDNLPLADIFSREACAHAAGDDTLGPVVAGTRAAVLLDFKRYAEAEPLMREAVEGYQKAGNETEEIRWLYDLGHCLVEQGKADEGLGYLRSAASRAVEQADPDLRAKSLYFFGRALYHVGKKEDALFPLKSSLRLAEDHDLRNEAFHSAFYLWKVAHETGDRSEANRYRETASKYRTRIQQRSEEVNAFDALK